METWNGPTSRVTAKAIRKGASLCYMTSDLDENMSKWDHCEKDEHYDAYDWKKEVEELSEAQQRQLFHSPLGVVAGKQNLEEEDD